MIKTKRSSLDKYAANNGSIDKILVGNKGNNRLRGGKGNDTLIGGKGKDDLYGGTGADTYVFSRGDNFDKVYTGDNGVDTIQIKDVPFSELIGLVRNGNDLIIVYDADPSIKEDLKAGKMSDSKIRRAVSKGQIDCIMIKNHYAGSAIGYIQFGEDPKIPFDVFTQKYPLVLSNERNNFTFGNNTDFVIGGKRRNIIHAGGGDDLIIGGESNDILYGDNGDDALYGQNGNDTLYGGNGSDALYGGEGNDILYGEAGSDYLEGGAGNDYLYGGDESDMLNGGTGNDHLYGGRGADLYVFNLGDGQDIIYTGDNNLDIIEFKEMTLSDIKNIKREGNNLIIEYGINDKITVNNHFNNEAISAIKIDNNRYTVDDFIDALMPSTFSGRSFSSNESESQYEFQPNAVIHDNQSQLSDKQLFVKKESGDLVNNVYVSDADIQRSTARMIESLSSFAGGVNYSSSLSNTVSNESHYNATLTINAIS